MTKTDQFRRWLPWTGVVTSGLLLAAAFPPLAWQELAWVALVPLMFVVRAWPPRKALTAGLVAGAVFWLFSIAWLRHVTYAGWITLALYNALYLAVFAAAVAWWFRRFGAGRILVNLLYMVVAAASWTALEYIRSHCCTGFPWNTLAISQYEMAPLRQLASWSGVYGLSALIVLFNAGVGVTLLRYRQRGLRYGRSPHPELMFGFLVLALAFAWGIRQFKTGPTRHTPVRVGLVQTNIPQPDKWSEDTVDTIFDRLRSLTLGIHEAGGADLVVWPETALPEDLWYSEPCFALAVDMARAGSPLLVGSMDTHYAEDQAPRYFNSSFLFDDEGVLIGAYDKQHLVIFGEYVPLQRVLPFVEAMTPIEASFTAGTSNTVFRLPQPEVPFSVLICFEDTMPHLARKAVGEGARLLVNQTNDAWFERSSAPRQHMAHCVFRCVENRVPAVRCANTGVSCYIDEMGTVREELHDGTGNTFTTGFIVPWVLVPEEGRPLTFYTRHGDVFARSCLVVLGLVLLLMVVLRGYPGRNGPQDPVEGPVGER
jgi:apolipoprotein N-acyltransferase